VRSGLLPPRSSGAMCGGAVRPSTGCRCGSRSTSSFFLATLRFRLLSHESTPNTREGFADQAGVCSRSDQHATGIHQDLGGRSSLHSRAGIPTVNRDIVTEIEPLVVHLRAPLTQPRQHRVEGVEGDACGEVQCSKADPVLCCDLGPLGRQGYGLLDLRGRQAALAFGSLAGKTTMAIGKDCDPLAKHVLSVHDTATLPAAKRDEVTTLRRWGSLGQVAQLADNGTRRAGRHGATAGLKAVHQARRGRSTFECEPLR